MLPPVSFLVLWATNLCERSILDFRSPDLILSSGLWLSKQTPSGNRAELGEDCEVEKFLMNHLPFLVLVTVTGQSDPPSLCS